ncbi:O-methyltransferase family protein [Actinidia rufa]|uniref:O-methyltransferase family protein n=1 Tax=Actinidia rufa TaxID=165716 RepID=A0A7J0GL53_9ERIC|nr:O-methyltransferase family protein [Actinidia rufa]
MEGETSREEGEVQAQVDIWKYVFGFVDIAVVKCAIELGIAKVVESHEGPVTISELSSVLGCSQSFLYRIIRFLVHRKFFKEDHSTKSSPGMFAPWHGLSARVLAKGDLAFESTYGKDIWSYAATNPAHSKLINVRLMLDMVMMAHTKTGKERTSKEWVHLLSVVGFSQYTIKRIKVVQSIIEAYP